MRGHTRRELLGWAGGALAALAAPGCGDNWLDVGIELEDGYDAVLDALHATGPEFSIGLSNHGPMVIDALAALGREDRASSWARRYARELEILPAGAPLTEPERTSALGAHERQADWIATYATDVIDIAPGELIAREWPTLAPAWASTHGVLRVAHALRALEREDTPSRRRELAHGLGYWAARFDRLPGEPGSRPESGRDVVAALERVPLVAESRRSGAKLIVDRLAVLEGDAAFVSAIEAVDLDAIPSEQALHDLVAAAARLYVHDGRNEISLLHTVTGTAALSLLWPYLDPAARRLGLGYAFQTVAAIHATHSLSSGVPGSVPRPGATAATLADRARERDEEHEIKLSEACLREFALEARPELLAAAAVVQR
jgi:hypothetical protein